MRALEFITGHVIYNPGYTSNFQLKTTQASFDDALSVLSLDISSPANTTTDSSSLARDRHQGKGASINDVRF